MEPKKVNEQKLEEMIKQDQQMMYCKQGVDAAKQELYELGIEIQRLDYFVDKNSKELDEFKESTAKRFVSMDHKVNETQQKLDESIEDVNREIVGIKDEVSFLKDDIKNKYESILTQMEAMKCDFYSKIKKMYLMFGIITGLLGIAIFLILIL